MKTIPVNCSDKSDRAWRATTNELKGLSPSGNQSANNNQITNTHTIHGILYQQSCTEKNVKNLCGLVRAFKLASIGLQNQQ